MTFHLAKELLKKGAIAQEKYEIGDEEESSAAGLLPIRMKLSESQNSFIQEMQRCLRLKVLLALFQRYLEANPNQESNRNLLRSLRDNDMATLSEDKPSPADLKRFLSSLKEQLDLLSALGSSTKSEFRLMNLKFKQYVLLQRLASLLKSLQTQAAQIRAQSVKTSEVDSRRLAAFGLLTTNLQLRADRLKEGTHEKFGVNKTANAARAGLAETLEEARDRLETIRAIIKNGGWGYIQKIKQKVQQLKQLNG